MHVQYARTISGIPHIQLYTVHLAAVFFLLLFETFFMESILDSAALLSCVWRPTKRLMCVFWLMCHTCIAVLVTLSYF